MADLRSAERSANALFITQRCCHQPAFVASDDFTYARMLLAQAAFDQALPIHAYAILPDVISLLVSVTKNSSLNQFLRAITGRYGAYFSSRYGRDGRMSCPAPQFITATAPAFVLACSRYIESSPSRAGLSRLCSGYAWSSYHANALGCEDELLSEHADYTALGRDSITRQSAYRRAFTEYADELFRRRMERALSRSPALQTWRVQAKGDDSVREPSQQHRYRLATSGQ